MSEFILDSRINSPELAHHIGFAEYPYVEMALAAQRVGLEDDSHRYLSMAESAGQEAGSEYLESIHEDLGKYALRGEFLRSNNFSETLDHTKAEAAGKAIGEIIFSQANDDEIDGRIEPKDIVLGAGYDEIPEGYLSIRRVAESFFVGPPAIKKAIKALGDELGVIEEHKISNVPRQVYSQEQQDMIREWLEANQYVAPAGFYTKRMLSELWKETKVTSDALNSALEELGDELGEPKEYRIKGGLYSFYSPAQIEKIASRLESEGYFAKYDEHETITGMAKRWSSRDIQESIQKAIASLGDDLGDPIKLSGRKLYTQVQQEQIKSYLQGNGYFSERAPEDYTTKTTILEELGLTHATDEVNEIIDELESALGPFSQHIWKGGITTYFSPKQAAVIKERLLTSSRRRKAFAY